MVGMHTCTHACGWVGGPWRQSLCDLCGNYPKDLGHRHSSKHTHLRGIPLNLMATAEGAPKKQLKAPSFPSLTQTGEGCAFTFFACILGGRAASQLDLTRAYRNIVQFSPSLLATHIAASCFWGWEEPRLTSQQLVAGPCHSIFVTGATATRKSNRRRIVARFQSSLN